MGTGPKAPTGTKRKAAQGHRQNGGHLLIMWATAERPHPFCHVGSAESPACGKVKLEVWEFSGHCGFVKHFSMRLVKSTAVGAGGRLCSAVAWLACCAHGPALPPVISASLCPGTPSLRSHPPVFPVSTYSLLGFVLGSTCQLEHGVFVFLRLTCLTQHVHQCCCQW